MCVQTMGLRLVVVLMKQQCVEGTGCGTRETGLVLSPGTASRKEKETERESLFLLQTISLGVGHNRERDMKWWPDGSPEDGCR